MGQETGLVVNETIRFLNQSVVANDDLRGQALRLASDLEARTLAYLETRSQKSSSDLTARELFDMMHQSYDYFSRRVRDDSAVGSSDSNDTIGESADTSPTPTRTTPFERGIFDHLPETGDLLVQFATGTLNLSTLVDRLPPATSELQSHGLDLLNTVLHLLNPNTNITNDNPPVPNLGVAASAAHFLGASAIAILVLIVVILTYAFDILFQCVLFFACLYAFVASERGVMGYGMTILGLVDPKQRLRYVS